MEFAPTDEQRAVIEHYSRSKANLMVVAKAGAAKTTTMLLAAKSGPVEPSVAVVFNVEIKKELEKKFPGNFDVLTVNGLGHRAWSKTIGKRLEIDKLKTNNLCRGAIRAKGIEDKERLLYNDLRKIVSAAKLNGMVLKNAPGYPKRFLEDTPEAWAQLFNAYDVEMTEVCMDLARMVITDSVQMAYAGLCDFDDQIYMSCCFGGSFPGYKRVVVDEAQDMSLLNHFMLRKIARGKVAAVGDPNQSIYAFRGADHESMPRLKEMFQMEELTLSTSFRCGKAIIAHAQQIVPSIMPWDKAPQGEVVWLREYDHNTFEPNSAVLCRNNAPLVILAFKMLKKRKAVRFAKTDIGQGLVRMCLTIADNNWDCDREDFLLLLRNYQVREVEKAIAENNEEKADLISDKTSAIIGIAEQTRNVRECVSVLEQIFSDNTSTITFSTGHGAKGKEWDNVYHLDSYFLPSKRAITPAQIQQEKNLDYVIRTRAKLKFAYIKSEGFIDL